MYRIRWENQVPWVHVPTWEESMALFFDMYKLRSFKLDEMFYGSELRKYMSDFDNLPIQGASSGAEISQYDAKMARIPNMQDRIKLAVAQAEEKLKQVKRAQEIFTAHPELEELLNIMQRNHF